MCTLLHRCDLKILAKKKFEKSAISVKIQQILQMLENLQNLVTFQKIQLNNLVDFEKCCKTRIFLQKSEPIPPKTSNIWPKFCQPTLSDVASGRHQRHAILRVRALYRGVHLYFWSRAQKNAFSKSAFFENPFFENFANFWRARSRLYQNEILQ
jgi:hypothetical protein